MKLFISFIITILAIISHSHFSHAVFTKGGIELNYSKEIDECTQALKNGTAYSIDPKREYLCPFTVNYPDRVYNIILDRHFAPIDAEADAFIEALIEQKTYYFGKDRKKNSPYGVATNIDFLGRGGYIMNQYRDECNLHNPEGIYRHAIEYLGEAIPVNYDKGDICITLAEIKTATRYEVANKVLIENNGEIKAEEQNSFFRESIEPRNEVFSLFTTHIGYFERIWKKWTSKTKDAY